MRNFKILSFLPLLFLLLSAKCGSEKEEITPLPKHLDDFAGVYELVMTTKLGDQVKVSDPTPILIKKISNTEFAIVDPDAEFDIEFVDIKAIDGGLSFKIKRKSLEVTEGGVKIQTTIYSDSDAKYDGTYLHASQSINLKLNVSMKGNRDGVLVEMQFIVAYSGKKRSTEK